MAKKLDDNAQVLDFFTSNTSKDIYKLPKIPSLNQVIADGYVAIDTEVSDPYLRKRGSLAYKKDPKGFIAGIGLANAKHEWYLPIRHGHGENLPVENVIELIRDIAKLPNIVLIFHNAQFDLNWFAAEYGIFFKGIIVDSMITAALLDEFSPLGLDYVGKRYLGVGKDESDLEAAAILYGINVAKVKEDSKKYGQAKRALKGLMWLMHPRHVDKYGKEDPRLTYDLYFALKKEIEKENLEKVLKMECDLIPMILDMTYQGIRISEDNLEVAEKEINGLGNRLQKELDDKLGFGCDVQSFQDLQKAFDSQKLRYDLSEKGNPTFDKDKLKEYAQFSNHWLPDLVKSIRECQTAKSLYFDPYRNFYICPDGKIHPSYSSTKSERFSGEGESGTESGRFASTRPNVQQIPSRTEHGKLIRGIFVPEPGSLWGAFDYSQQEFRMLVHYARIMNLTDSDKAVEYYKDPDADYHEIVMKMCGLDKVYESKKARDLAKTLNFGMAYGMGGVKLCKSLNLPTKWIKQGKGKNSKEREVPGKEGADLLNRYHENVPFVREFSEKAAEVAQQRGYITTIDGRRARFPFYQNKKNRYGGGAFRVSYEDAVRFWGEENIERSETQKTANRIIQGGSAGMMKMGMLAVYQEEKIIPLATVHDEMDIPIYEYKQAKRVKEIMLETCKLCIPHKVDFECGSSWGKASRAKDKKDQPDQEHFEEVYRQVYG